MSDHTAPDANDEGNVRGNDDVRPEDLTSPHTVDDPQLEQQRAEEAAERERESRATDETKFEQLREQQEAERAAAAQAIADVPASTDES